mmetsp:Transcript_2771/g.9368  ORF Transcript_2771/g.9368 Transcript_2771/m.9368 type:complete len:336 (-) Transcript_2771:1209-2216(-)
MSFTSTLFRCHAGPSPQLSCSIWTRVTLPRLGGLPSSGLTTNTSVVLRSKLLALFSSLMRPLSPASPKMVRRTLASVPAPLMSLVYTLTSYARGWSGWSPGRSSKDGCFLFSHCPQNRPHTVPDAMCTTSACERCQSEPGSQLFCSSNVALLKSPRSRPASTSKSSRRLRSKLSALLLSSRGWEAPLSPLRTTLTSASVLAKRMSLVKVVTRYLFFAASFWAPGWSSTHGRDLPLDSSQALQGKDVSSPVESLRTSTLARCQESPTPEPSWPMPRDVIFSTKLASTKNSSRRPRSKLFLELLSFILVVSIGLPPVSPLSTHETFESEPAKRMSLV